jgi:hypothetical protein
MSQRMSRELASLETAERKGFGARKVKKTVKDSKALLDFIFGKTEINPVITTKDKVNRVGKYNRTENQIFHADNSGIKLCKACNTLKPVTDYYKSYNNVDGFRASCKVCFKSQTKEYAKKAIEHYNKLIDENKTCICEKCNTEKLISGNFNRIPTRKNGFNPICKECLNV